MSSNTDNKILYYCILYILKCISLYFEYTLRLHKVIWYTIFQRLQFISMCLPLLVTLLILRTSSGPGIWYTSVKMTRITGLFFPCLKPHPPYSWKCWDNAYNTIFERGITFCLGFYQINHAKYVGLTEKVSYSR